MFVAFVSAGRPVRKRDVNEILDQGAGWTKGSDGYKYDVPQINLDNVPLAISEPEPVYNDLAYTENSAPSFTATTTYTDSGFSTNYDVGTSYSDNTSGSYGVTENYPSVQEYTQDQSLREYLPPALRRRRLRLQKRRLRFVRRH